MNKYSDYFVKSLEGHGIVLSDLQLLQFDNYAKLLIEWNNKMNLTAILDLEDIYEKHFLDSILPSFYYKIEGKLCDVGAGAGFPSLPLKIIYPELEVTIVEPLGKRCLFLNEVVKQLKLNNVTIANERSEDYVKLHREEFDIVSARAVANLAVLSELCIPLVKMNGTFLALKGMHGDEEYNVAKKAIDILGCELIKRYEYKLSDDSLRINFAFKKIKHTAIKYPRVYGKIKKSPLGGNI
ncbi:MAG: 16S rRNA (guanine(527)-N(7))-methyltransferase RsmG [Erysipelotrichaceae bacterium]